MIGIVSAALASSAVAGADYTVMPLLVTLAARIGIISPPPSLSWVNSPGAISLAGALYLASVLSRCLGRPGQLKILERALGVPFAVACLAAVGMGAAAHAGLDGHLLRAGGTPGDWLETKQYVGTDAAALASIGAVAFPLALLGKAARTMTERLPFAKGFHTVAAAFGVSASAFIARLPAEVRLGLAAGALAIFAILAWGIVRRIRSLLRWWHDEEDAPIAQRIAVVGELILPGSGAFVMRRVWSGIPRLLLAALIVFGFVLTGPIVLPVYIFIGLGGALNVTRLPPPSARPRVRRGAGEPVQPLAGEFAPDAIGVSAATGSDDDW
jgi:hypothetical protein